jgi:hypothetical protein
MIAVIAPADTPRALRRCAGAAVGKTNAEEAEREMEA